MKLTRSDLRGSETNADRIRALATERKALGSPLQYAKLPAICDGTLKPSSLDLACIADEAGVRIEFLLGIRGLALVRRNLSCRRRRLYWGWWRGIGRHRCGPECNS